MNIVSFSFFTFVVMVFILYWLIPQKLRNLFLLAVSYLFYACYNIKGLAFILFSTLTTFYAGKLLEKEDSKVHKRIVLVSTIVLNAGLLLFFKYTNFLGGIAASLFSLNIELPIITYVAPLGISFYTFQVIGYVADIYNKKISAERNIVTYGLYVAFFVKIVQGPIENSANLLQQLKEKRTFEYQKYLENFFLILIGLFKKTMIADRVAVIVDTVYGNIGAYGGGSYIVAAVLYSIQIYCDFSGYTDIVRGCAGLMGYDLLENFKQPYLAGSIKEFWRRWHISLTRWFTTYVYIPLGGNRKGNIRWGINIIIVFLVSGIWHGAAYNFILWGGVHALYQIVGSVTRGGKDKILEKIHVSQENLIYRAGSIIMTFALSTIAWIFFRLSNIHDIAAVLKGIFSFQYGDLSLSILGIESKEAILIIVLLILLVLFEICQEKFNVIKKLSLQALPIRWLVYLLLIFSIIMFGVYGNLTAESFIYMNF